jgi:hypothetical protein
MSTSALAEGWRDRLVKVQNVNTAALSGVPQFTGWCLERHDLCAAKLCAFREKDCNFVGALSDAQLIDAAVLAERLSQVPASFAEAAAQARQWLIERESANDPGTDRRS